MSRAFGYRRYGTPGEVVRAGPWDEAVVATEFGTVSVRHRRGSVFAVGDYVVIGGDGLAEPVPRPSWRARGRVPVWVRLVVALVAPFRSAA